MNPSILGVIVPGFLNQVPTLHLPDLLYHPLSKVLTELS